MVVQSSECILSGFTDRSFVDRLFLGGGKDNKNYIFKFRNKEPIVSLIG